jgi:hypothetical protein
MGTATVRDGLRAGRGMRAGGVGPLRRRARLDGRGALTPTAFSAVMRRFYGTASDVLGRFVGTVDRMLGDGDVTCA